MASNWHVLGAAALVVIGLVVADYIAGRPKCEDCGRADDGEDQ